MIIIKQEETYAENIKKKYRMLNVIPNYKIEEINEE